MKSLAVVLSLLLLVPGAQAQDLYDWKGTWERPIPKMDTMRDYERYMAHRKRLLIAGTGLLAGAFIIHKHKSDTRQRAGGIYAGTGVYYTDSDGVTRERVNQDLLEQQSILYSRARNLKNIEAATLLASVVCYLISFSIRF